MNARAEVLQLLQEHIKEKKKSILKQVQENSKSDADEENNQQCAFDIIIHEMFTEALK